MWSGRYCDETSKVCYRSDHKDLSHNNVLLMTIHHRNSANSNDQTPGGAQKCLDLKFEIHRISSQQNVQEGVLEPPLKSTAYQK